MFAQENTGYTGIYWLGSHTSVCTGKYWLHWKILATLAAIPVSAQENTGYTGKYWLLAAIPVSAQENTGYTGIYCLGSHTSVCTEKYWLHRRLLLLL